MGDQPLDEKTIFQAACSLNSPQARRDYLDKVCGNQPELRQRVSRLLEVHAESPSFLEAPATGVAATLVRPSATESPAPTPGQWIGPYKLLEQIGEGGMGVVYVAEQREPVRRKVALKVIKPGMDTRQVVARFEAERQALALMNHPHIAKVLDAGTTPDGRPYFVMELVRGEPITTFCDEHQLDTRQRLDLFVAVCRAVQHAHLKGVIHRDLKPSNVLVELHDVTPQPKVIDFGVAKATNQQLTDHTLHTGHLQIIGTPMYMSPEQAQLHALDVDTRSDVYSLGVLLYELLTGSTPFDGDTFKRAGFDEMRRMIREIDPPRPSQRVSTLDAAAQSTVAQRRRIGSDQLRRWLGGELDWIVMKALEKDRARRYESASVLAADVERFLHDEPVLACPPSPTYRMRKFVRRYRGGLIAAALLVTAALVTAGTVGASALRNCARIRQTEQEVRQTLAGTQAAIEAGDLTMASRLAAEALGRVGADRPALSALVAEVEETQREVTDRQADAARFQQFIQRAAEAQDRMFFNGGSDALAAATGALAIYGIDTGDAWLSQLEDAHLTAAQRLQVRDAAYVLLVSLADYHVRWKISPDAARHSQTLLDRAHGFHDATRAFHFVQERIHRILGNMSAADAERAKFEAAVASSAWDYFLPGHTAGWDGDQPAAIAAYKAALRIQPSHFNSLFFLAMHLGRQGNSAEAAQVFRACQALHPDHNAVLRGRAEALQNLGEFDEAVALARRNIQLWEDAPAHGSNDARRPSELPQAYGLVGSILTTAGRDADARVAYEKALALSEALAPEALGSREEQFNLVVWRINLANTLSPRAPEVRGHYRAALAQLRRLAESGAEGLFQKALAIVLVGYGQLLCEEPEQAEPVLREAVAAWETLAAQRSDLPTLASLAGARKALADVRTTAGRTDEAGQLYRDAARNFQDAFARGQDNPPDAQGREPLANAHADFADLLATCPLPDVANAAQAAEHARRAIALRDRPSYWVCLGIAQYRQGELQPAIESLQRALAGEGRLLAPDVPRYVAAMAYGRIGDSEQARRLYDEAAALAGRSAVSASFRREAEQLLGLDTRQPPAPSDGQQP
jgi:serine/threonine protein kinase/tetratricopeptide (TPR) repeat protein